MLNHIDCAARSECATLESPTTSGASLVEEAQSYVTEETTDDEAMDFDFEHDAESETSSSPEENSDLDISATQLHLLSRPSASTPFCIPAVCMASHETILDVMASALQQRRAWGLADVPLLGLAFHPCSTRLNTFWGWFDEQGTGTEYCVVCLPASMMLDGDNLMFPSLAACPQGSLYCCSRLCTKTLLVQQLRSIRQSFSTGICPTPALATASISCSSFRRRAGVVCWNSARRTARLACRYAHGTNRRTNHGRSREVLARKVRGPSSR